MAQATREEPELTYGDVRSEFTKFKARVAHTNVKGVKHLNLSVDRPFRSTEELAAWLHGCVNTLRSDIDEKNLF